MKLTTVKSQTANISEQRQFIRYITIALQISKKDYIALTFGMMMMMMIMKFLLNVDRRCHNVDDERQQGIWA